MNRQGIIGEVRLFIVLLHLQNKIKKKTDIWRIDWKEENRSSYYFLSSDFSTADISP
jgi:hypothetical protein